MILILTEKPSQAKNFEAAFGFRKGKYNGVTISIVSSVGHIFAFPEPHENVRSELKSKYKDWTMEGLPFNENDFVWKKYLDLKKKGVYERIKNEMVRASEVVIATDNDPDTSEGTLLASEIILDIGYKGQISRMYFESEFEKEILRAFNERVAIKGNLENWGEYLKADSRSKFDYLSQQYVRLATILANNEGFNVVPRNGRLKSVMTYLIYKQFEDRRNYVKKVDYTARFKDENGHFYKKKDEKRFEKKEDVPLSELTKSPIKVVKRDKRKTVPPLLPDLSKISAMLAPKGYKPKEVLDSYTKLYSAKIASYPRTEDKKITTEQYNELEGNLSKFVKLLGIDASFKKYEGRRDTHIGEGMAHGANRPGPNVPKSMKDLEKYGKCAIAIYELLLRSTVAMFSEDYEYIHEEGVVEKYPDYKGYANVPSKMGFKSIYDDSTKVKRENEDEESEDVKNKPLGKIGTPYVHTLISPKPSIPTIKWLISKLEKNNVGSGATRTSTIADISDGSKDKRKQLVVESRGKFKEAPCGEINYRIIKGTEIANPSVTEKLLKEIGDINKGKYTREELISEMRPMFLRDKNIMVENAGHIKDRDFVSDMSGVVLKDKTSGNFGGKDIKFNRVFAGHKFTDGEVEKLLAGKEIFIEGCKSKKGNEFSCYGKLEKQKYKGKTFYGFKVTKWS